MSSAAGGITNQAPNTTPPTQNTASTSPANSCSWRCAVSAKYNKYIELIDANVLNTKGVFNLSETEGLIMKIVRVVGLLISSVALLPLTCLSMGYTAIKDFFCESVKSNAPANNSQTTTPTTASVPTNNNTTTAAATTTPVPTNNNTTTAAATTASVPTNNNTTTAATTASVPTNNNTAQTQVPATT